jgi:hypothetical protein
MQRPKNRSGSVFRLTRSQLRGSGSKTPQTDGVLIAALDGCSCIQAQRVGISVAFHAPTTLAASVEFADRKAPGKYRDAAENMQLSKNLFTLVQSRARAMTIRLGDGPASLRFNWLNEVSQQPIA